MNLRWLLFAAILVFLPYLPAVAGSISHLIKSDFTHAEKVQKGDQILIGLELSPAGRAKVHDINQTEVNHTIELDLAGRSYRFVLREAIVGDRLQAGPFAQADVLKILNDVNGD